MSDRDLTRWAMTIEQARTMSDAEAGRRIREMLGLLPGVSLGFAALHLGHLCIDHYTEHDAAMGQSFGANAYSLTDPNTWTRAQLVVEVEARMGLRAPESAHGTWEWDGDAEWGLARWEGEVCDIIATVDAWGRSPLTGPDGAFAAAEKAAHIDRPQGEEAP